MSGVEGLNLSNIVSLTGAIFAGSGLFYTAISFRQNTKSRYLQVLNELHTEITSLEGSQERNYDYDLFAVKYLNLHDRIAYLAIKKVIPKDIARFFDSTFEKALALLEKESFKKYEDDMGSLKSWCNKQGITPTSAPEPYPIPNKTMDIATLTDIHKVKELLALGWKYKTSYPATNAKTPHYILMKEPE